MKQTKSNSYNSTPFSSKENLCPNVKFSTINPKQKKNLTPSIATDPEFSIFNTINVNRPSQSNTITTKSRADMQAIIQTFSHRSQYPTKECHFSHKSFLDLLGLAIGKQEFSMQEAIEKCEEYQISSKDQLVNILQSKQPTREWPLPISNLLLTDLGQLKIMHLCSRLQNEEDLSQNQIQIVQFLLPKANCLQKVDKGILLQHYHDFRNKIDQKFNLVDNLVQEFSLRIQPKIRKIDDKVFLIKVEKRFRRFQKLHKDQINYSELKSCIGGLNLSEDEILTLFKYLFFIEKDRVIELVDRKMLIKTSTCIKEILERSEIPFAKQTISRIEFLDQNTQVINDLLVDKHHLLELLESKDQKILKLNNTITLLTLRTQNQAIEAEREKKRQLEGLRGKYIKQIEKMKIEGEQKDNIIEWYRNELNAAVEANQAQIIAKQKHHIFRQIYHESRDRKMHQSIKGSQQVVKEQEI